MSTIIYKNKSYSLEPEETLLQCLLRHQIEYPNSCHAGICQSCLIKAKQGFINPRWQIGLPDTLKAQGYFLACMALPDTELQVTEPDTDDCDISAKIVGMQYLNYNIMQIKLSVENLEDWIPGQYLSLINTEGLFRNYSIANIPKADGYLELHIKIVPNGDMGQWFSHSAELFSEVKIRGPFGSCYYHNPQKLSYDILLAGTGVGLSPLVAITKDALSKSHQGKMSLIHGGLIDEDIYYQEELTTLAANNSSFYYYPCVLNSKKGYPQLPMIDYALNFLNQPKNTRVFVCGPKVITDALKKRFFLAGVPSSAILSDAFLPFDSHKV